MVFTSGRNIRDTEPYSINNTGDRNIIIVDPKLPRGLNRSLLFDYCEQFSNIEDAPKSDTDPPSHIPYKMEYNEITEYKEIFYDVDHYFDDVESVLEGIIKRDRILSSIKYQYRRFKGCARWDNKDGLCNCERQIAPTCAVRWALCIL